MNAEMVSILKTVAAAGLARSAFNDDANRCLERLKEQGLLIEIVGTRRKGNAKTYKLTEKGKDWLKKKQSGS
jgi:predicted transcriptional regulator